MIIKEFYTTRKDGVNLYKTFSDKKVYIKKQGTDEKYDTAIDVENAPYIYEETEEVIDYGNQSEIEVDNTENR